MTEPKTILIVGASSKAAEGIARVMMMETQYRIVFCSSQMADIGDTAVQYKSMEIVPVNFTDRKALKEVVMKERPAYIINCAAYTNVDGAETEKELCWKVNVKGVENLVHYARVVDAHLIHFSTDYLFDGKNGPYAETATPSPLGYYGKSKLAGENVIKSGNLEKWTILRTNVLYGATHDLKPDFVIWVLEKLAAEKKFSVVDDQWGNPTLIDDIGLAVERIIAKNAKGVYNIGGGDYISRFDFAQKIAEVFQQDSSLIKRGKTSDLKQVAERPMRGGLITLKAETELGMSFAGIEAGLITTRRLFQQFGVRRWKLE